LLDGSIVSFNDIGGMTELEGLSGVVTFVDVNNFTVPIDSTAFTAFTQSGYWVETGPFEKLYFSLNSEYTWHRFFATCFGQYLSLILTYDNNQMSELSTHQQLIVLNAMKIYFRPGGRNIFGK
jgi:hypothetical protein